MAMAMAHCLLLLLLLLFNIVIVVIVIVIVIVIVTVLVYTSGMFFASEIWCTADFSSVNKPFGRSKLIEFGRNRCLMK